MRNILLILTLFAAVSCFSGKKEDRGPEAVVVAFNKALLSGDLNAAGALCDSAGMCDYLQTCSKALHLVDAEDSSLVNLTSAILSESEVRIVSTSRQDKELCVIYVLETLAGNKQKKAKLGKEEGEWKILKLTDMN